MNLLINSAAFPLFFLALSLTATFGSDVFNERPHLTQLSELLVFAAAISFLIGSIWGLRNIWLIVQAFRGNGSLCSSCGGPAPRKMDRNGLHYKCWSCGKKNSIQ
jgi:hypothetical protein